MVAAGLRTLASVVVVDLETFLSPLAALSAQTALKSRETGSTHMKDISFYSTVFLLWTL